MKWYLKFIVMPLVFVIMFLILTSFNVSAVCNTTELRQNTTFYYTLQEAVDPFENIVFEQNLTGPNLPADVAGIIGQGKDFDGINDQVNTSLTSTVEIGSPFFVSFWLKDWVAPGTIDTLIATGAAGAVSRGWNIKKSDDGANDTIFFNVWDAAGALDQWQTGDLGDGWIHVVCTHDQNNVAWCYLNGTRDGFTTSAAAGQAGYTAGNHRLWLGNRHTGIAGQWGEGLIDEVIYGDYNITADCIQYLYNAGAPGADQQYPYGPPTSFLFSLLYPLNETHYTYMDSNTSKNYNGSIVLSTTENGNCTINDSRWITQETNLSTHHFINATPMTSITEGNYSLEVNCTRSDGVTNATTFWFYIDPVDAVINITSPVNNTFQTSNFWFNATAFDMFLYRVNATLFNSAGEPIYRNYSGNLGSSTTWYNFSHLVNISNGSYPYGNYSIFIEATDTHTAKAFKEKPNSTTFLSSEDGVFSFTSYRMERGGFTLYYPKEMQLSTIEGFDRWHFEHSADEPLGDTRIYVEADSIDYLEGSSYPCHMIINNYYWYDCDGFKKPKVKQIAENLYEISFKMDDKKVKTKSLGGLNIINTTINFTIGHTNVNLSIYDCLGGALLNDRNVTIDFVFDTNVTLNRTTTNGTQNLADTDSGGLEMVIDADEYDGVIRLVNVTGGQDNQFFVCLVNSSLTTDTIIRLIDESSNPIESGIVTVLMEVNNSFVPVADLLTNFEGETVFGFVRSNTQFYRFEVRVNNILIQTTAQTLIFRDELVIQVAITEDQLLSIKSLIPSTTSLTFVNNSGTYRYTFTYAGGDLRGARLTVTRHILTANPAVVVENTSTSQFGTLTVDFIPQAGVRYTIEGFVDTNTTSSEFPVQFDELFINTSWAIFGLMGIFATLMIVGTFATLLSRGHPSGPILGTLLGMFVCLLIGIFNIEIAFIIMLCVVGGLIIFVIKDR